MIALVPSIFCRPEGSRFSPGGAGNGVQKKKNTTLPKAKDTTA
jgi:hypothetical protein